MNWQEIRALAESADPKQRLMAVEDTRVALKDFLEEQGIAVHRGEVKDALKRYALTGALDVRQLVALDDMLTLRNRMLYDKEEPPVAIVANAVESVTTIIGRRATVVSDPGVVTAGQAYPPEPRLQVTDELDATDDHNQRGLRIHVRDEVPHPVGSMWNAEAYFSRIDGTPLRDSDGRYATTDSQVWVGYVMIQQGVRRESGPSDYALFLPYTQLHLADGHHDLKYHVEVKDPDGLILARSNDHFVRVTSSQGEFSVRRI